MWLAAGEASSKAAVTAATRGARGEYPVAYRRPVVRRNDAAAYEQLRAELPALYLTGG